VNIVHYEMNIESPSSASIAHEYCTGFMHPSQPERTTCKLEFEQPNLDWGYSTAFHWHVCVHVRWNAC